jgi:hypothetical protein
VGCVQLNQGVVVAAGPGGRARDGTIIPNGASPLTLLLCSRTSARANACAVAAPPNPKQAARAAVGGGVCACSGERG